MTAALIGAVWFLLVSWIAWKGWQAGQRITREYRRRADLAYLCGYSDAMREMREQSQASYKRLMALAQRDPNVVHRFNQLPS